MGSSIYNRRLTSRTVISLERLATGISFGNIQRGETQPPAFSVAGFTSVHLTTNAPVPLPRLNKAFRLKEICSSGEIDCVEPKARIASQTIRSFGLWPKKLS